MEKAAKSRSPLALIVNEHEWSARSLESILAARGYVIVRAHTGKLATDRVRSLTPDVIIIDANLPDMAGIDLCRALRHETRVSLRTPILITAAGPGTRRQRIDALSAGGWDFLGSPVDSEELVLKLEAYVQARFEADRAQG